MLSILFALVNQLLTLKKTKVKIIYRVLPHIFSVVDEESLSPKQVIAPCLTFDLSNVVGKPSNFLRSKSGKINNKKSIKLDIIPEFTIQPQNNDQSSSSNLLGKHCEKLDSDKDIFDKILEGKKYISKVLLSIGAFWNWKRTSQNEI